jgi:hypothetical protein
LPCGVQTFVAIATTSDLYVDCSVGGTKPSVNVHAVSNTVPNNSSSLAIATTPRRDLFSPLDHVLSTLKISHCYSSANAVIVPQRGRLTYRRSIFYFKVRLATSA